MPAIGDVLTGRYRIDARLGAGGMATVWRARDLRLERDVAVKVLLPNLAGDPAFAARFDREARALAAVGDPHVVGIHDVVPGSPGVEPFLVMELCPDGSLGDRLADGARLAPNAALPILADAAAGLAALHARSLVHRDVTPRNILLVGRSARLGDLGLAQPEDPSATPGGGLTATGAAVGTLGYLAPEILEGRPATTASDVYGLAAVAYRTLAGTLPRAAGSIAEVVAASGRLAAPIASLVPGLPANAAAAIDRALDPEPAPRPTAAELATAFRMSAPTAQGAPPRSVLPVPPAPDERTDIDLRTGAGVPRRTGEDLPSSPKGTPRGGRKPLPPAGPGYHGPSLWSGELIAAVAVAIVVILVLVVVFGGPFGGSTPAPTPAPSLSPAAAGATATPEPTPSPTPSPTPTPTPSPTPDPFAAALAYVDPVRAAIEAARGADGLKGKEIKGLEDAVSAVASAVARGDAPTALDAADRLDERVRAVLDARSVTGAAAERLAAAVADLVSAVGRLQ